jgi:hypothetical protein
MRSVLGRLIIWIAEMLDRSLLTVPDIDEHRAPVFAGASAPLLLIVPSNTER